jgi:predicted nucleic acid-binding protein
VADGFLLDTSAIFALSDREEGADIIATLLENAAAGECHVMVCAASLMELYYVSLQERSEEEAAQLVGLVKTWPVSWIYPNEKLWLLAGRLKAFRKLSFADALIAGSAKLHGATLVHKDPELEDLTGEVALQRLPFKRRSR